MMIRNLVLIFTDQLDQNSAVFDDFSSSHDRLWMSEADEEYTAGWAHKLRIAFFLSAKRHFRAQLMKQQYPLHYHALSDNVENNQNSEFRQQLVDDIENLKPQRLVMVQPGSYQLHKLICEIAEDCQIELDLRPDRHFYCEVEEFAEHAKGRKQLRLEYFYRFLRKKHGILVDQSGEPEGESWNYDRDNREAFPSQGPETMPSQILFQKDSITKNVLKYVKDHYHSHPGKLDQFDLPVTRRQALLQLRHFIKNSLPRFGKYQDAMWVNQHYLYHSRLSALLNLKILNPRECINAVLQAYHRQMASLSSVEGFIRQILGWREFVRGVYWLYMPGYAEHNYFNHQYHLPTEYWDGETEMCCVRESMQNVVQNGYAHHIQRLMVLGNLAQLIGVHPMQFHKWHMAMYLDAHDWVSLPNTLGMSQFADGGVVGSKPYCASGNYINKMSNYCKNCRYDYKLRTGERACPFTTLYWDFLDRQYDQLKHNPRMKFQIKNLEKLRTDQIQTKQIREDASKLKKKLEIVQ